MAARGGVTVDGIKVNVSADTFSDFDVIEAIADVNAHQGDDVAQLSDVVRLLRLVFGSDYGRVKSELRSSHDGRLTAEDMVSFFNSVAEEVGAKNS